MEQEALKRFLRDAIRLSKSWTALYERYLSDLEASEKKPR